MSIFYEPGQRPLYPYLLSFKYMTPTRVVTLCDLEVDNGRVKVIGEPGNGVYEWVLEYLDGHIEHSNRGYGVPECALRDGLAMWWGDDVHLDTLKKDVKTKTATQLKAYSRTRK